MVDERIVSWLVKKYGGPFGLNRDQREELAAEARAGLVEGAARYDPARGAKVSSYAVFWGRKRVIVWLRRELAGGQHVPEQHGYVMVKQVGLGAVHPEAVELGREADPPPASAGDAWWEVRMGLLSPGERSRVERRFRYDRSVGQIARADGVDERSVRAAIHRGLSRLREHLTPEGELRCTGR